MSHEDRVLALFADANPVSDEANLDELTLPSLQLIEQREREMSDTEIGRVDTDRPLVKQAMPRGIILGVAAAMVALVLGTIGWLAAAGSGEKTLEEAAADGDATAVVELFYQRWSQGDVEGAHELVVPSGLESDRIFERALMEFVVALEPDGWSWSVADCGEVVPDVVQCTVRLVGDPVADVLGLQNRVQFRLDGSRLATFPDVGSVELRATDAALARYAEERDRTGYAAACASNASSGRDEVPVYTADCGAFLSDYLQEFAATLEP